MKHMKVIIEGDNWCTPFKINISDDMKIFWDWLSENGLIVEGINMEVINDADFITIKVK